MTDADIEKAVKKMILEDANHPPEARLYPLYEKGIIDAQGRVFSESLTMIEDLLREKRLSNVSAFHRGHVPGGAVRLHEKIGKGREDEGPYHKICKIIEKARDHEDLWNSLQTAGYCQKTRESGRKKTG
jgi:hypothetical protein